MYLTRKWNSCRLIESDCLNEWKKNQNNWLNIYQISYRNILLMKSWNYNYGYRISFCETLCLLTFHNKGRHIFFLLLSFGIQFLAFALIYPTFVYLYLVICWQSNGPKANACFILFIKQHIVSKMKKNTNELDFVWQWNTFYSTVCCLTDIIF